MSEEQDKIARAHARAERIEKLGRHFIGPIKPDYYDAYSTVRPLLARLTNLSTRSAYRSFKMIGQLQRICRNPYLPECILEPERRSLVPIDDPWRKDLLRTCALLCSAVYPLPSVLNHGLSKIRNTKHWFVMKYRIEHLVRSVSVILATDQGDVCKPAHAFCIDKKSNTFYVVIRGSSTPEDFITNLMCDGVGELGPHRGMSLAAEFMDNKVRPYLEEFLATAPQDASIVLTGHSLGAGVAALLTTRWNQDESMMDVSLRTQCIALACPAIFHEKDSYADNSQIKTIVFGKDLVPRLSYSSFSDLLIQMTALSHLENSNQPGVSHAQDALSQGGGEGSSTRATSLAEDEEAEDQTVVDLPFTDDQWMLLPEPSYSPKPSGAPSDTILLTEKIQFAGLTESEASIERACLQQALEKKGSLSFGGASFNQINLLLRKNLKLLQSRKELIIIENQRACRFSWRWWMVKTVYKVVKFWHRLFRRSREKIQAENELQELALLNQCYQEISDLKIKNENGFTPPGRIFLCVPRIHFLEQDQPRPPTKKSILGQCYLFEINRHEFIHHALDPNWSIASINQHGMECYLQALAPDTLKNFPMGIVAEEEVEELTTATQ